jgi:hypothetical protein
VADADADLTVYLDLALRALASGFVVADTAGDPDLAANRNLVQHTRSKRKRA